MTTCPKNLSQQPVSSILSTKSYLLTKINHQDNYQRCASTKHNITTHNHHQDQYVLLIIQVCYIIHKPCVNNTTKKCLQPCTMYQSCIKYSSTMTHKDVPTSSTIHLMQVPTHQLLVSTMYLNHGRFKVRIFCQNTKGVPTKVCRLNYEITYDQV